MPHVQSFAPVIGIHPKVLILGSMPGVESLNKQQYYAHPRNGFWSIMGQLLNEEWAEDYHLRIQQLKQYPVILWDVLKSCERRGSLDSAISTQGIEANDIPELISRYPGIQAIVFNGATAEKMFRKHVLPKIDGSESLEQMKMPSTSPAHTSKNLQQKCEEWRRIMKFFPTVSRLNSGMHFNP